MIIPVPFIPIFTLIAMLLRIIGAMRQRWMEVELDGDSMVVIDALSNQVEDCP